MRQPQLRRRTLFVAVITLTLHATGIAFAAPSGPPDAGPSLHRDGELPLITGEAVIVDNSRQHLITVKDNQDNGALASAGELTVYGGDPFHAIKRTTPSPWVFPTGVDFHPVVYAWDETGRRLYLVAYPSFTDEEAGTNPELLVTDDNAVVRAAVPLHAFAAGVKPWGMSYDASAQRLFVIGQRNADPTGLLGTNTVQLAAVSPVTGEGVWSAPYSVPSCQKVVADALQAGVHYNSVAKHVFLGCGTGTLIATNEPGTPTVASIDVRDPAALADAVDGPGLTNLHPLGGIYGIGESLVDAAAGKLVMISKGNGVPSQAAWIFDEVHEAFTGVVNAGDNNVTGVGLDPATGRLFLGTTTANDEALLLGNVRFLRTPQATHVPFKGISGPEIVSVPFRHDLLIPTGNGVDRVVNVYRSKLADVAIPSASDPDASTSDLPEAPGRTAASYSGDVGAFGARIGQVGGANGVIRSVISSSAAV